MKTRKIIGYNLLFFICISFSSLLHGQAANTITTTDSSQLITDTLASQTALPPVAERGNLAQELTQAPDVGGLISFPKIFWSVVFLLLGYFSLKILTGILNLYAERKPRHKSLVRRVLPMIKILVWSMVVYIIVSGIFSPPKETVLAFFASIGVAIGFASQDLLKNLFGGLMILFDKPFQIGDRIETGKYYGEVVEIGIRSTRIVTPGDNIVSVPNSEIMNQSISNTNSGLNNCLVSADIYLPHLIDTQRVRQIAIEVAQISKYVYLNKPIAVIFFSEKTNKEPVLKMRLNAYVMNVGYEFLFKSEMTELVLRELKNEGLM